MKKLMAIAGLTAVIAAPVAQAAVSDQDFNQVRQMLEQALNRIDELEAQQQANMAVQGQFDAAQAGVDMSLAEQVQANTAKLKKSSWAERIKLKGDFRYRYQNDDVSDLNAPNTDENDGRNRNRIRARLGILAELPSDVDVGFALATGSDDPISSNQTLGGGESSKDIFLDQAYFDWNGLDNTNIRGGKFKNTFETVGKSQLQWDGDWRPEGSDVAWDNGTFFAQGLGTYLESDSDKDTEFGYILQAGARGEVGGVSLTGGVGYTDIDAEGSECFFETDDALFSDTCFGNQTAGGEYINNFQVYNVFAQAGFEAFNQPVTIFGDYINNSDADDYDQGYLVGFQVGKVKKKGSWQLKYYYEDIEGNSTLALLANSDFGGGGTNGKGSVLQAGYGLTDQSSLKLSYYLVERNSDNISTINGGETFDVDTLQVDLNFKYK